MKAIIRMRKVAALVAFIVAADFVYQAATFVDACKFLSVSAASVFF